MSADNYAATRELLLTIDVLSGRSYAVSAELLPSDIDTNGSSRTVTTLTKTSQAHTICSLELKPTQRAHAVVSLAVDPSIAFGLD